MSKARVGLLAVASRVESGGERAEELLAQARAALTAANLDVVNAGRVVWNAADALAVAAQFRASDLDAMVVIHASWVMDSIQYLLTNIVQVPVLLWAVPYVETFSLAYVQHYGSILRRVGQSYQYVYGLPDDRKLQQTICDYAAASKAVKQLRHSHLGLIGPRQTWRTAGAQDMTGDEWEFTRVFGATIVHIEMEELLGLAQSQQGQKARDVLAAQRRAGRLGRIEADEERLLYAAGIFLGLKELYARYDLTAATAECYPNYGSLTNLPSSWLADEGVVLDTEGDLGHTAMMLILRQLGAEGPVALAEAGVIDEAADCLLLVHEGSTAVSLAEEIGKVHIMPGGDKGTTVGFPMRPMKDVTLTDMCGGGDEYQMLIAKASVVEASTAEWENTGRKFLAKVKAPGGTRAMFQAMLEMGADHHVLLKEGDVAAHLQAVGDQLRLKVKCLP